MEAGASAYMMIFRESTPEVYQAMSAEQRREALRRWNGWCDELAARGGLRHGNPLLPEGRVVSGASGTRPMDGPFAEAKELIGGYLLLVAGSLEEVEAMARQCPSLPYGLTIEIRPVASGCHLARSLGLSGMREPAEV